MLDFSFAEIALIVIVTVVFIGPKELPVVIRAVGKVVRGMRSLSSEIRQVFDELTKESGIKDATDAIDYEINMIKGDDGNMYESYVPKKLPTDTSHGG